MVLLNRKVHTKMRQPVKIISVRNFKHFDESDFRSTLASICRGRLLNLLIMSMKPGRFGRICSMKRAIDVHLTEFSAVVINAWRHGYHAEKYSNSEGGEIFYARRPPKSGNPEHWNSSKKARNAVNNTAKYLQKTISFK